MPKKRDKPWYRYLRFLWPAVAFVFAAGMSLGWIWFIGRAALNARLESVGASTSLRPFDAHATWSLGFSRLGLPLLAAALGTAAVLIVHRATDVDPRHYKESRRLPWAAVVLAVGAMAAGLICGARRAVGTDGRTLMIVGAFVVGGLLVALAYWVASFTGVGLALYGCLALAAGFYTWVYEHDGRARYDVAVIADGKRPLAVGLLVNRTQDAYYMLVPLVRAPSQGKAGQGRGKQVSALALLPAGLVRCPASEAMTSAAPAKACYLNEIVMVDRSDGRPVTGPREVIVDPAGYNRAHRLARDVAAGRVT